MEMGQDVGDGVGLAGTRRPGHRDEGFLGKAIDDAGLLFVETATGRNTSVYPRQVALPEQQAIAGRLCSKPFQKDR